MNVVGTVLQAGVLDAIKTIRTEHQHSDLWDSCLDAHHDGLYPGAKTNTS